MEDFQQQSKTQIQNQQDCRKLNLIQFARNEFLSDCVLVTEGKLKLPSHKIILASHSKLFYEFFKKYPQEKEIQLPIPITMKFHQQFFNAQIIFNCVSAFYYPLTLDTLFSLGMNQQNCLLYLSEFASLNCTEFENLLIQYIQSTMLENQQTGAYLEDFILLNNEELIKKCIEFIVKNFEKLAGNKEEMKKLLDLPVQVFQKIIEQDELAVSSEDIVLKVIINYFELRDACLNQSEFEEQEILQKQKEQQKSEKKPEQNKLEKKVEERKQQIGELEKKEDKKEEEKKEEQKEEKKEEQKEEEKKEEQKEEKKEEQKEEKKKEEQKEEKKEEQKEEKKEEQKEEKKEEQKEEEKKEIQQVDQKKEEKDLFKKEGKKIKQEVQIQKVQPDENKLNQCPPQLYDNLNLNEQAIKKLRKFKLREDEKKAILLKCRLSFVTHEFLISSSMKEMFKDFKDILFEAISAKLCQFESSSQENKYIINLEPRLTYKKMMSPQKKNAKKFEENQVIEETKFAEKQNQKQDDTPKSPQPAPQQNKSQMQTPQPKTKPKDLTSPIVPQREQALAISQQMNLANSKAPIQLQVSQIISSKLVGGNPFEFNYQNDGDENGALYYLGTCGYKREWANPHKLGIVKAFFSSLRAGAIEDFVGRTCVNCSTLNEKNSFMAVDLGDGRQLSPECYSITNRNLNTHVMLNWVLEGSLDGTQWYVIDRRIHFSEDEAYNQTVKTECELLKKIGAITTWGVDILEIKDILAKISSNLKQQVNGFRFFRIVQFMKNSHGSFNLNLSGFELYGKAHGEWLFGFK